MRQLWHMPPAMVMNNSRYGCPGRVVLVSKLLQCDASCTPLSAHGSDIDFSKSFATVFTANWVKPLPYNSIVPIVLGSSKIEVCRVNTAAVVARMQNHKSVWYWPVRQLVGKSMGSILNAVRCEVSITIRILTSSPLPALIHLALLYLGPKSIDGARVNMVAGNKPKRFSLLVSEPMLDARLLSELGHLAATALAVTAGDFLNRIACSILNHVNLPCRLAAHLGARNAAGAFSCPKYSTVGQIVQNGGIACAN
jgi:hypothetical protein